MSKASIIEAIDEAAGYLDNEVHQQVSYDVYSGMHELLCQIHKAVDDTFGQWLSTPPKESGLYFVKFCDGFSTKGVNVCQIHRYADYDFTMHVMGRATAIHYSQFIEDRFTCEWHPLIVPTSEEDGICGKST